MKSVRLERWCGLSFLSVLLLTLHPGTCRSQIEKYCAFGDSSQTQSIVYFTEEDGDGGGGGGGGSAPVFHEFGTSGWPNEFDLYANDDFKAFRQVFHLHLTQHVSGRFDNNEWRDILNAIMNNDTTATRDDVFSKVWDYFVRSEADSNPYYAGVRFKYAGGDSNYTWINIYLFDPLDYDFPSSTADQNKIWVHADNFESVDWILGQGVAHELQHICFGANGSPTGYAGINESLSTLAEYFLNGWGDVHPYNLAYDASFMDNEPCDIGTSGSPKYRTYKAWMIYLYEVLQGNPSDPTDDAMYQWIRNGASLGHRLWLDTFANLLWDNGSYDWLGGADATDRLNRLYANFLVAKYCNAPDFAPTHGEFGIGPINAVTDLGFFTDNDSYGPSIPAGKVPDSPVDCPPYEVSANNWYWTVRVLPRICSPFLEQVLIVMI